MINILSDNLLLLGYARGVRKLTTAMVRECFEELNPKHPPSVETPQRETATPAKAPEARESYGIGFRKWALIGVLAIVLFAASFHFAGEMKMKAMTLITGSSGSSKGSAPAQEKSHVDIQAPPAATALQESSRKSPPEIEKTSTPAAGESEKKTEDPAISVPEASTRSPEEPPPVIAERTEAFSKPEVTVEVKTIIAQDGDTLDKLAKQVYGRSDEKIWEIIQQHNPDIQHVDMISRGQKIVFPPLETPGQ
jgi:phage tail protein X